MIIVSPFDDSMSNDSDASAAATSSSVIGDGPFELTYENVDMVLDSMRTYLIQDGGNVKISEIDGSIVRLELEVSYGCVLFVDKGLNLNCSLRE